MENNYEGIIQGLLSTSDALSKFSEGTLSQIYEGQLSAWQGALSTVSWNDTFNSQFNANQDVLDSLTSGIQSFCNALPVWNGISTDDLLPNYSKLLEELNIGQGFASQFKDFDYFGNVDFSGLLSQFSDSLYEQLLNGTDYTREDVENDLLEFTNEMQEYDKINNNNDRSAPQKFDDLTKKIFSKYPALYYIYIIINFLLVLQGLYGFGIGTFKGFENAFVCIQGNNDLFAIKTENAKLYTEPNCKSSVITNLNYSDVVTKIEDIKMWTKATYEQEDGTEIVGWIAKRNLMKYVDYEFHSDDLYDISE